MNARRLLFALSATFLLIVPCAASAHQHDDGDRWDGGYSDRGDRHWDRGDREDRHWDRGNREDRHWNRDDRYAWNHDEHRYWNRERHCWISDRNYYWDSADYHWVPDNGGNFILVHLSI